MTLKQNEITAIRSGSHLLPDSRAVVTCDLGSMITTIIRRQNSPGFGIVHSANSSVAKETAPPGPF